MRKISFKIRIFSLYENLTHQNFESNKLNIIMQIDLIPHPPPLRGWGGFGVKNCIFFEFRIVGVNLILKINVLATTGFISKIGGWGG